MSPEKDPLSNSNHAEDFNALEVNADNQARNEALLGTSELGIILTDAYRAAVDLDPRMANIEIVPIVDPEDSRHGYASSKESKNNVTGNHEVHIRLNDLDQVLNKYKQAMQEAPEAIGIIADQLGVSPEDITPQTLYVQSILHEMGHLTEHMDAEEAGEPRAPIERRKVEMQAMPLGALAVGKLAKPASAESVWFEANWQQQAERHGVSTREELIAIQSVAYRALTSEKIADNFAADVFLTNPQLLGQVQHGSLESYRATSAMTH